MTGLKRILIIDNSPALTGAFKSIFQVTEELSSKVEFIYVIPKGSKNKRLLESSGIKVIKLPFIEIAKNLNILWYLPQLLINTFKINSLVKKHNIEIVHVNDLYNMIGVLAKVFNPKTKLVYHVRLLPNSYARVLYPLWKKLIERYADELICVSESVAKNFNKEKTKVIYDALSIVDVQKSEEKASLKNTATILYLANYIPGKGHKQSIEAFHKALPNIGSTKLIFFGGTLGKTNNQKFKKSLIQFAHGLNLNENVVFNDFAKYPEEEISKADLMLNFSESESFSMTTLESLAYGTPIIVTDCGGPSEIIENGKSGLLVPVNDIDTMSNAIVKLANNPEMRNSMASEGIKRVNSKFNIDVQINKLQGIYNELLSDS